MFCSGQKRLSFCGLLLYFFLVLSNISFSQRLVSTTTDGDRQSIQLEWRIVNEGNSGNTLLKTLQIKGGGTLSDVGDAPVFKIEKEIQDEFTETLQLKNVQSEKLSSDEVSLIQSYKNHLKENFFIIQKVTESRRVKKNTALIVPIRYNQSLQQYEKLISFTPEWIYNGNRINQNNFHSVNSFATNSVLSTGKWFKLGIKNAGVYKIDKGLLTQMGLDVSTIDPRNIRIYGNGGAILPELNSSTRPDDLIENAIEVVGESDGVFNDNDYVLFYAAEADKWNPKSLRNSSTMAFDYQKHYYSDSVFYFLNTDIGLGKRIASQSSLTNVPTHIVNSFDDYAIHESDASNLIKSGREFYGESFEILNSYNFNFSFLNLMPDTVRLLVSIAGRNFFVNPVYSVTHPAGTMNISCLNIPSTQYTEPIANENSGIAVFNSGGGNSINIDVNKITSSASGWLNFIQLNVRRSLIFNGQQMHYRDLRSVGSSNIGEFQISGTGASTRVWNISDLYNINEQTGNLTGSILTYTASTSQLNEYIVFTGNGQFPVPNFVGEISNQNLHALAPVNYLIISHKNFLSQAVRLGELHKNFDTLSYAVVSPEEIYNEFSGGSQDISAIRDFIRMIYWKSSNPDSMLKYVLLFGDGSYNNKDRYSSGNTNFIPTYQTIQSLSVLGSRTSDDFYGLLDPMEGLLSNQFEVLDVGVGRLVTKTTSEAEQQLNKIENYYRVNSTFDPESTNESCSVSSCENHGDWRNWITLIADDLDASWETFVSDCESMNAYINLNDKTFNVDKIYIDAYNQITVPGGERYPDAVSAINARMNKGTLFLSYTGHGGELGLAHEDIINIPQIQSWNNSCKLSMWLTATCEFSRFDDPGRTSAGEHVLMNPAGGGIGLFTTTRLAFKSDGTVLGPAFFNTALSFHNGERLMAGDIIRLTKDNSNGFYPHFTLLGDPALLLSFPRNTIVTSKINNNNVTAGVNDTIRALQLVTIDGYVADRNGNKINNFNGVIYPTVFDKATSVTTLNNDGVGSFTYPQMKSIIYKGKSRVVNGDFSFSFRVPKDIAYNFNYGKISYYAHNGLSDAGGYYDKVIVGGSDTSVAADLIDPQVKLYMNDNKFVFGGLTNENPKIYAEVFDSSGINTVGNGIGHDLTAILDANTNKQIILNDYYESELNNFMRGKIVYPFNELSDGRHTLSLKVWDAQNNSGESYTEFVVAKSEQLALEHVLNYPNPFTTSTRFYIEHNNPCDLMNIEIQIFTVSGKIVKTIQQTVTCDGFRTDGIHWDAKDDYGDKLARGVYIYRVKAATSDGKTANKFEKLVILN